MSRLHLLFVTPCTMVLGAAIGAVVNTRPVEARVREACANTYCEPGWTKCPEEKGWHCFMDGGCAGAEKCTAETEE